MRSHRLDSIVPSQVMDHLVRRECARADRSGQKCSLVLFRVNNGQGKRRALAVQRLARTMLRRARLTDDVGWLGEQHLAALLPDTTSDGARAFADGVASIVALRRPRPLAIVYTYPREASVHASSPEGGRLAAMHGAPLVIAGATASVNGNSHAHVNGNTNGYKSINGNGNGKSHRAANGNGHAVMNGDDDSAGNGHAHAAVNGNGHPHVNGNGHMGANRTANAATIDFAKLPATELPVVGMEELLRYPTPQWKRLLDIFGALTLMVLLAPVLAAAAIAIKLSSPGPILFTQRRSGLGGKPFLIYKLRTMIVGAEKRQQELRQFNEQDGPAFKLTRDPRVTRVGALLRKTSIDELPQLWNVIKGDMSLVGPRPLPILEQEGCEQWQRHRLNVAPGLTCIWQVKGRSQVSFADWVRMDVEYIRRRTIFHDLLILFSTIPAVILRRGAR